MKNKLVGAGKQGISPILTVPQEMLYRALPAWRNYINIYLDRWLKTNVANTLNRIWLNTSSLVMACVNLKTLPYWAQDKQRANAISERAFTKQDKRNGEQSNSFFSVKMCRAYICPLCRSVTIKYKNGAEKRRGEDSRKMDRAIERERERERKMGKVRLKNHGHREWY